MDEIKYKIRRSLLLAVNDYPVTSLEYVLKHPFIQALSVDVEIIRIEWFKLIKYGYLKPIAGYDNTVRINEEQIDAIKDTGLPVRDEFLWGVIAAPEVNNN